MKFFCNGAELSNATNIVSKAISPNKNIPILEGIRIEAIGNNIVLSAYNNELFIEKTISADVYEEGEVIVNGKLFNDCANKISSMERIGIEKDLNEVITISFGKNSTMQLNYYESVGFARFEKYSDKNSLKIKERDLKELLEQVIFCVFNGNDTRLLTKCCYLVQKENYVESVCLDGFRFAVSRKPMSDVKGSFSCVVLGKIISDILKIMTDSEEDIILATDQNSLFIDLKHTKIKTLLSDCKPFNYEGQLKSIVDPNEVIVNKNDILALLDRASVISRENGNGVFITVENNRLSVTSKSEKGNIDDGMECKYSGDERKIYINNKYLAEAIQRIKEDYVKLIIEDHNKPILVKQVDGESYLCMILLIRMMA